MDASGVADARLGTTVPGVEGRKWGSVGFSLVELLVVVAIMSILFAISLGSLREENKDGLVEAEAERLASVLRRTRNRAMATGMAYGVAFNVTNGVGTSGAILNNWDGGHWYAVIGPKGAGHDNFGGIPLAGRSFKGASAEHFPIFIESVKESWVQGQKYVLPQRQVRFLALSDTDEGPRRNPADQLPNDPSTVSATNGATSTVRWYTETYPRPWFGYYDQTTNRLWPWGGYDNSVPTSGFHYEGDDGVVTGSVNPTDRIFRIDIDGDGTVEDYEVWKQDDPRAVVNADWLDACIMFTAEGEARYLEWNRGRRAYANDGTLTKYGMGVADRAKKRLDGVSYDAGQSHGAWLYTSPSFLVPHSVHREDNGGAAHFFRHTGGFNITLSVDALVDDATFGSVQEAVDSIDPAWRVFVGESGAIRPYRVQRRVSDSFLSSRNFLDELFTPPDPGVGGPARPPAEAWPADPDDWLDSTKAGTVFRECRTGWLHDVTSVEDESKLDPYGAPIVDVVSGRMLTDRIWWVK